MSVADEPIYLDSNATTPILPEVLDAMLPFLREHFGNPSSAHVYGARARAAVDHAREQVASLIGAQDDEIIFTSGGTEANNLAIRGAVDTAVTAARSSGAAFDTAADAARTGVVTSVIEHPATERPCAVLERLGVRVVRVGVDEHGRARIDALRAAIDEHTAIVTLMHSNNETGVLQPVREAAAAAQARGALVHTDAAQSAGKVPLDVNALGVDLLSIAGHKLYAPKGVGALFVRRGVRLLPVLVGAGHERGVRPGTENVGSIVGLGVACKIARHDVAKESARVRELRDELAALLTMGVGGLVVHGAEVERLPNTLSARFPGVSGTALLERCAADVAASTGSACHDGAESASRVITAMGVAPDAALGTVRMTLGRGTTLDDVVRAARSLVDAWTAMR